VTTLACVRCERPGAGLSCACGALLEVLPAPPALSGEALRALFASRRASRAPEDRSGVWRYRELVAPDVPRASIVARGEGNTGLYRARALEAWVGLAGGELWLKHEGENPTGSFKDRGMCVGVSAALRDGARLLACASTGNTSASLASYAAIAGVPCVVFIPEGKVALGKLAQTIAYGARVLAVKGSFDLAMTLVDEAARAFGLGLLNSINPWRIEGQKAIALELLDDLGWTPPDWIVLPAGNLGNISAIGKGLREAKRAGIIDRLPRVAGVQAEGASPFARYMRDPKGELTPEPHPETVATAIRIGAPRSWEKARREVQALDGAALAVSDGELLEAKARIDAAGVGCEPASAASVAGLKRLVAEGRVAKDARVVAILTGHLLKDPETTISWHETRNRPTVVEGTLDAIGRALAITVR
jgi:threonine synthase